MGKRKIIIINEEKCNGCGLCIPNCPEGAIQIIDSKAALVSDLFCDGLGACIGHCPQGAITIEEREAQDYNEKKVMENVVKQGRNVIKAHLEHLRGHNACEYLKEAIGYLKEKGIEIPIDGESPITTHGHSLCPGSKVIDLRVDPESVEAKNNYAKGSPQLKNWPVQIKLVPPSAPYFENADILIAADCVPFAYADFHRELLTGKILLVGCPKLDDIGLYQEKLSQILKNNKIKSITYAHMEVPCCFSLVGIIKSAIQEAVGDIPFKEVVISIKGEKIR